MEENKTNAEEDESSPLLDNPRSRGDSFDKNHNNRATSLFQRLCESVWCRWHFRIIALFCFSLFIWFHAWRDIDNLFNYMIRGIKQEPVHDDTPAIVRFVPPPVACPKRFEHSRKSKSTKAFVGNASRANFGDRLEENLVLCESFENDKNWKSTWLADKTLFGEGNGGFAYYRPENVHVHDGALHITPDLFANLGPLRTAAGVYNAADVMVGNCTPFPACATLNLTDQNCTIDDFAGCQRIGTPLVTLNPVTSGRISTVDRFEFQYGRLEARIRLPAGDWLWPALWLMPANASNYGNGWPDSGEVDLMESKGNDPTVYGRDKGGGRDVLSSCLHYHGNSWWKTYTSLSASDILLACRNGSVASQDCDWSTDFFTIGLYWSPTSIFAYVLREEEIDGGLMQQEIKLWEVNASSGFGPDDFPLGINYPPFFENDTKNFDEDDDENNPLGPYASTSPHKDAPFDKPFYVIINLSVGGELNGCPNPGYWGWDAIWCTEQIDNDENMAARTVFWNRKDQWYPSWQQAKQNHRNSFTIDWVKVYQ